MEVDSIDWHDEYIDHLMAGLTNAKCVVCQAQARMELLEQALFFRTYQVTQARLQDKDFFDADKFCSQYKDWTLSYQFTIHVCEGGALTPDQWNVQQLAFAESFGQPVADNVLNYAPEDSE